MKKIVFLIPFLLIAGGCHQQAQNVSPAPIAVSRPAGGRPYSYSHQLMIGEQTLSIEIARTQAEMEQGLSGRQTMTDNEGMLFDFSADKSARYAPAFWMKDMKFPLDFIWIANDKVIGITADAPAPTSTQLNLPLYPPPAPVNQVLEVNAGWSAAHKIKTGDQVRLND